MPLINIHYDIDKVESGAKTLTFMKNTPKGVKVGEACTVYTGMPTKNARKVGTTKIVDIFPVKIGKNDIWATDKLAGLSKNEYLKMSGGIAWEGFCEQIFKKPYSEIKEDETVNLVSLQFEKVSLISN